jgi:CRISPR/Cas system-associated exonuclease Cas4 (RecB family)
MIDLPHKIFSVSELETYERCPREYYLKYVLGLPSIDILKGDTGTIPANVRGSIVHSVIQRYDPENRAGNADLIMSLCLAASVNPDKKTLSDIERLLATFAGSDLAKHIGEGRRELRFDWRFENSIINGSIDWLKPEEDGFSIVDFKTDTIAKDEVERRAAEYDLQLVTYALAVAEATGKKVSRTALYFLEPDALFSRPMDAVRANEGKEKLRKIIASIRNEIFDIEKKTPPCRKCPYKHNGMCGIGGKV